MSYSAYILPTYIAISFLGLLLSLCETATPTKAVVTAQADKVEITFIPTRDIYYRSCVENDYLGYCTRFAWFIDHRINEPWEQNIVGEVK